MDRCLEIRCDYCQRLCSLKPTRHGHIWQCHPCDAYVGAYPNSPVKKPMGRLANAELRAAKKAAHEAFNPLWRNQVAKVMTESGGISKGSARGDAYRWLAEHMDMPVDKCAIGRFDVAQCKLVVEIVAREKGPFEEATAR